MRIARLLVVALLVLIAGRTAAAQEIKTAKDRTSRPDYVRPFAVDHHAWASRPRDSRRSSGATTDDVCLTMHTLVVARDDGGDSTRLVAQRTCTPSRQFETKSAVVQLVAK
jgi:hypothetical protein